MRTERGLGKSSSQCKGPGVRDTWSLTEHLKEGQCGWRVKHLERSGGGLGGGRGCHNGPGAYEGVEAVLGRRSCSLCWFGRLEAGLASFLLFFPLMSVLMVLLRSPLNPPAFTHDCD